MSLSDNDFLSIAGGFNIILKSSKS